MLTYKKVPRQSLGKELTVPWTSLAGSMLDPGLVILSYLFSPFFFCFFFLSSVLH